MERKQVTLLRYRLLINDIEKRRIPAYKGDTPIRIYSQCFYEYEDFVPLSRILEFIGYQNIHIVVIEAREGRASLTQILGITVEK
jgi:hypothetical protein